MNTDLAALRELVRLHNERGSHSHGDESKADQEARYKAWVAACYEAMPALSRLLEAQAGVPDTKQARTDHTKLTALLEATHDMVNESPRTPDTVSVTDREYKAVRKLDMCYDALSRTLVLVDQLLTAHPPSEGEAHE
jgi:hypothetical protein